jgi:hypothetical protein
MGKANKTTKTKGASTVRKTPTAKNKSTTQQSGTASTSLDRRGRQDRRKISDRRKQNLPVATQRRTVERRAKVNRRRQIDPTTCERDYTPDEIEFMNALDDYKRLSGRMFPTCSEVLEVIKKLGYEKPPTPQTAGQVVPVPGCDSSASQGPETTAV